jgi:branched-subunit amino acid ABC-type transport system permease component
VREILGFGLVVLVLLVRPSGLFGRAVARRV